MADDVFLERQRLPSARAGDDMDVVEGFDGGPRIKRRVKDSEAERAGGGGQMPHCDAAHLVGAGEDGDVGIGVARARVGQHGGEIRCVAACRRDFSVANRLVDQ